MKKSLTNPEDVRIEDNIKLDYTQKLQKPRCAHTYFKKVSKNFKIL